MVTEETFKHSIRCCRNIKMIINIREKIHARLPLVRKRDLIHKVNTLAKMLLTDQSKNIHAR